MGRFSYLDLEPSAPAGGAASAAPKVRAERSVTDLLRDAEAAYARGHLEIALRCYSRALGEERALEVAWLGELSCLLDLGEYQEAASWADQGIAAVPASADIRALRAVALARVGQFTESRRAIDEALGLRNAGPLVWWARGDAIVLNDPTAARHCFDKYLAARANDWLAWLRVGKSQLAAGDAVAALRQVSKARDLEPSAAIVWFFLGRCHETLGMRADAVEAFERAARLNPSQPEFNQALARLRGQPWHTLLWRRIRERFRRASTSPARNETGGHR